MHNVRLRIVHRVEHSRGPRPGARRADGTVLDEGVTDLVVFDHTIRMESLDRLHECSRTAHRATPTRQRVIPLEERRSARKRAVVGEIELDDAKRIRHRVNQIVASKMIASSKDQRVCC